jgi:hypothetical protein
LTDIFLCFQSLDTLELADLRKMKKDR